MAKKKQTAPAHTWKAIDVVPGQPLPEPRDATPEEVAHLDEALERRAPDQDGAIEVAFVEAVLPEEDRRTPAPEPEPAPTTGLHVSHPDQFAALSGTPNRAPEPELPTTDDLHGFSNPDVGRAPIVTD